MKEHLSTHALARLAGVNQSTIFRAVRAGKLKASRTPGGHLRIAADEAAEFLYTLGVDAVELTRRRLQVLGVVEDAGALEAAVAGDDRFELSLSPGPLEAGIRLGRDDIDIVVLEVRLFNGSARATIELLHERGIKVLGIGAEAEAVDLFGIGGPGPDAWARNPADALTLRAALRELAEGTRIWKLVSARGAGG